MQFDIMGSETLLLCRCDTDHSEFITSVVDERDHEYVLGATIAVQPLQDLLRQAIANGSDGLAARSEWIQAAKLKTYDEAVAEVATKSELLAYRTELSKTQFCSLDNRRKIAKETVQKDVFFDWELPRSSIGQYMFKSCVKAVIERAIAAAPLGDVTWARMDAPVWKDLVEFHTRVAEAHPGRLFGFGYTGNYDFAAAGFSEEQLKTFHLDLAKMGVVWQVQPVWAGHGHNNVVENFSKMWSKEGIAGYIRDVYKPEVDGFEDLAWCGGYLADAFATAISGAPITPKSKTNGHNHV